MAVMDWSFDCLHKRRHLEGYKALIESARAVEVQPPKNEPTTTSTCTHQLIHIVVNTFSLPSGTSFDLE